jgi:hypothetical protein
MYQGDFDESTPRGGRRAASLTLTMPRAACDPARMPLPPSAELLEQMDRNMVTMYCADTRATPGGEVTERPGLVLCGTPRGTAVNNMALVVGRIGGLAVRELTAQVYGAIGRPFSVWTRAHADAELEAELADAGFHELIALPGMVYADGDGEPIATPPDIVVRPVLDDGGRAAYADVMAQAYAVYGAPEESTRERFALLASLHGPDTQAFVAWKNGRAVAGATLVLAHGVGGVNWVGTLPAEFGRGYGATVTWAVVQEGLRRGARFLNLQASPMGAPVYRRMGFTTPTHYRVHVG